MSQSDLRHIVTYKGLSLLAPFWTVDFVTALCSFYHFYC